MATVILNFKHAFKHFSLDVQKVCLNFEPFKNYYNHSKLGFILVTASKIPAVIIMNNTHVCLGTTTYNDFTIYFLFLLCCYIIMQIKYYMPMNKLDNRVLYYKITHVEDLLEIFHVLSSSFFTKRVGTRGRYSDNFFIIV